MDFFKDVLPYRLVERERDANGFVTSEEYVIPDEEREAVLAQHYPFEGAPNLDDEMEDIHAEKTFRVRDYKLVRENGCNLLVSPYYYESGGSVIDWMPLDAWVTEEGGASDFDANDDDDLDMSDFDNDPLKPGEIPF